MQYLDISHPFSFHIKLQKDNAIYEVIVSNLPEEKEPGKVKSRLKQLCENSGGRVGFISKTLCSIRFPSIEFAVR